MFRLRFTMERQPRAKNGQPPHRTTGLPSKQLHPMSRSAGTPSVLQRLPGDHCPHGGDQYRDRQKPQANPKPAVSYRQARGLAPRLPKPSWVREPCRRWGNSPARCARLPDAWGTRTQSAWLPAAPPAPRSCRTWETHPGPCCRISGCIGHVYSPATVAEMARTSTKGAGLCLAISRRLALGISPGSLGCRRSKSVRRTNPIHWRASDPRSFRRPDPALIRPNASRVGGPCAVSSRDSRVLPCAVKDL